MTRYFGGVLQGTGGLTRAYTKGASVAIKAAGIVEKVKGLEVSLTLDYDLLGKIQYICGQNSWHIEDTEYTDKVKIRLLCETTFVDTVEKEFIEATNGKISIEKSEEDIYFKDGTRLFKNI